MVWQVASGKPLRNLPPVEEWITSVAFSPNNADVLVGENPVKLPGGNPALARYL
ncbi:MAG: hypothetical protein H6555_00885 [Lewinellaceae bacterium]|nr:hypothetical protein [Lewinellaceae bacterium]